MTHNMVEKILYIMANILHFFKIFFSVDTSKISFLFFFNAEAELTIVCLSNAINLIKLSWIRYFLTNLLTYTQKLIVVCCLASKLLEMREEWKKKGFALKRSRHKRNSKRPKFQIVERKWVDLKVDTCNLRIFHSRTRRPKCTKNEKHEWIEKIETCKGDTFSIKLYKHHHEIWALLAFEVKLGVRQISRSSWELRKKKKEIKETQKLNKSRKCRTLSSD